MTAALFAGAPTGLLAQGAPSPAAPFSVGPGDASAVTGSVFTARGERFQLSGVRSPRVSGAACAFERLRGRDARKALQRFIRRNAIEIVPTGGVSGRGNRLVNVRIDGRSLRTLMIRTKTVLPSSQARGNPWCVRPTP